jgi:hypothetical protein
LLSPPKRRPLWRWLAVTLAVGLVLGAGVTVEIVSTVESTRHREALDGLVAQLARLETRLAAAVSENESLRQASTAAGARVETLAQRLAQTEASGGALARRDEVQALAARIAEVDERLRAQLAASVDAAAVSDLMRRLGDMDGRLQELARQQPGAEVLRRIEQIEARFQGLGRSEAALNELGARVRQLEGRSAQGAAAGALAVLAARLREGVRLGRPFQGELNALRVLVVGNPSLAEPLGELAPYAARGAPTVAELRDQLNDLAPQIVASGDIDENSGWWQRTWHRLRGLVVVRRVGVVPGPSVEAVVARAEAALRAEDLPTAVEELAELVGPPAQLVTEWLGRARTRLAVEEVMRELDQRLLAVFGGS